jgi:uncharacterized damage-inducible protein DinB
MLRQLRHDVWASEKLIEHCRALPPGGLDVTVPGTYGTIRRIFMHIVAADERYLRRFFAMPEPLIDDDSGPDMSLDDVAAHLQKAKEGIERLFAGDRFEPDRTIRDAPRRRPEDPPLELEAWILVTQFAHHGSDHRAQIGTILGAHGMPTPDIDVWAYAKALGAIREVR